MDLFKIIKCYVAKKIKLIRRALLRQRRPRQLRCCKTDSKMSVNCHTLSAYKTSDQGTGSMDTFSPHAGNQTHKVVSQPPAVPNPIVPPFKIRGAQTVFFGGCLYLGGGHTGNTATDRVVLRYHPSSNTWEQLPPSPLKWFGMVEFNNQLVLVGGREVACKGYKSTNKIAVWGEENKRWIFSLPPMMFARVSPIVYGYKNHLIVAGGDRGSLDYSFEVFDSVAKRWMVGSSLPVKCLPHTSAINGESWILLDTDKNCILSADMQSMLHLTISSQNSSFASQPATMEIDRNKKLTKLSSSNSPWTMAARPYGELVGMTLIGGDLFLRVERCGSSIIYIRNSVTYWKTTSFQNYGDELQLLAIVEESA